MRRRQPWTPVTRRAGRLFDEEGRWLLAATASKLRWAGTRIFQHMVVLTTHWVGLPLGELKVASPGLPSRRDASGVPLSLSVERFNETSFCP